MARATIEDIRRSLRLGRLKAARDLLATISSDTPEVKVERAFLALLEFAKPADALAIMAGQETSGIAQIRRLLAEGVAANRLRDPLKAIEKIGQSHQAALAAGDPALQLDALAEMGRVHIWMGDAERALESLTEALALAEQAGWAEARALVLWRLAELYAEIERWAMARRFLDLSAKAAILPDDSLFLWQFLDCSHRTDSALGNSNSDALPQMLQHFDAMPKYLQFRALRLAVEKALETADVKAAAVALARLQALPDAQIDESFENIVATELGARLKIAKGSQEAALAPLRKCLLWCTERELIVPATRIAMLLSEALYVSGQQDEAASTLARARDLCARRGLNLQREKIDQVMLRLDMPPGADFETDRQLEKNWSNRKAYVLRRQLGAGGQGQVFEAWDSAREQLVAFKRMGPPGAAVDRATLDNLRHEVAGLSRAGGPGVARIIACGSEEGGVPYIVQELVRGDNFRALLQTTLDPRTALQILAQVSDTLEHLHSNGLVHGDVKPENIIIASGNRPVLVDFTMAQFGASLKRGKTGGTKAYLPPGHVAVRRAPAWCDGFALGVMLLESLSPGFKRVPGQQSLSDYLRPEAGLRRAMQALGTHKDFDGRSAAHLVNDLTTPWRSRYASGLKGVSARIQSLLR